MASSQDELVFVPLGGLGEIGMNAALYGFGPEHDRKWILVDCGMGFGGEENLPGIDLVYPDLSFIEEERKNLLGIFITHAHEDHIGALVEMWPRLRAPVYATRFAIGLLETRRLSEPGAPKIDLHEIVPGNRLQMGRSTSSSCRWLTRSGIECDGDPHRPRTGGAYGRLEDRQYPISRQPHLRGEVPRPGRRGHPGPHLRLDERGARWNQPKRTEVAQSLAALIKDAPYRVAITTFASNVARLRSVADAARICGREVVVVGRAMDRVVDVAKECGFLDDLPEFRTPDTFGYLPRDKVVALLTRSQDEPRAALARIASDEHPDIALSAGDRVIFSSRAIPGNEKGIGTIINNLISQGIEVITDRTHMVHVSGHPRRGQLAQMYQWTRPRIAVPAHGEPLHLSEHANFARAQGVPEVVRAKNGSMVRLAPGPAAIIDEVPVGRLYRDGDIVIGTSDRALPERRKLAFAGLVSVAIAIDGRGEIAGDPVIDLMGLPAKTRKGDALPNSSRTRLRTCWTGSQR